MPNARCKVPSAQVQGARCQGAKNKQLMMKEDSVGSAAAIYACFCKVREYEFSEKKV